MHDPMVVAFDIVRPWPQRSGMRATPGSERWKIRLKHTHHDDCPSQGCTSRQPFPWWRLRSYGRFWRLAGRDYYWPALITVWHCEPHGHDSLTLCRDRHWRWHIHHWRIQVPPLQHLRRALLTRCAWCGGRSRKGDLVNISHQWDGPRGHWWQGEPGLFHHDCSAIDRAHATCQCPEAMFKRPDSGYGDCMMCGRFRPWNYQPDEAARLLTAIPPGGRITADTRPAIEAAWEERRHRKADA